MNKVNWNKSKRRQVIVAMSGGVDSSVAALLMVKAGYDVVGVTMRLFANPFEGSAVGRSCCSTDDVNDARAVCRAIGIRHLYLDFQKEFEKYVINYFVSEYERGYTPHPCIACNDKMKFDFLFRRAKLMDTDVVATGHYARIKQVDDTFLLLKGKDPYKDQSYVLFGLNQNQMRNILLPVGSFSKQTIREIAQLDKLPVADKPDSQDICFIPFGNYREFIEQRLQKKTPGNIVDTKGNVLGTHTGIHNFTIGQRKGLPRISTRPMYVKSIEQKSGRVTVGHAEELFAREATLQRVNWITAKPAHNITASVRIRYNAKEEIATVIPTDKSSARVVFDNPVRAITPGQAAVFYEGSQLIGGGIITE